MRVYLAGKIGHRDWRHDIIGGELRAADGNGNWSEEEVRFGKGHVYVGPFFVGCDHGCSHSLGEHGVVAEQCQRDRDWHHDLIWCGDDTDRANRAPEPDLASGECERYGERRSLLLNKCMRAIDAADIVFAWVDDPTCFGTLWELGYAKGRRIATAIGLPHRVDFSDLWFAIYGAGQAYRASSASEALERSLAKVGRKMLFFKCESPIETALLAELVRLAPDSVQLEAQHETLGYRLDFSLVAGSARVAIECDGHDFHERTKEQARRDRKRDRVLTKAGWRVARFTGSEIHADAERCAREAVSMLTITEAAE